MCCKLSTKYTAVYCLLSHSKLTTMFGIQQRPAVSSDCASHQLQPANKQNPLLVAANYWQTQLIENCQQRPKGFVLHGQKPILCQKLQLLYTHTADYRGVRKQMGRKYATKLPFCQCAMGLKGSLNLSIISPILQVETLICFLLSVKKWQEPRFWNFPLIFVQAVPFTNFSAQHPSDRASIGVRWPGPATLYSAARRWSQGRRSRVLGQVNWKIVSDLLPEQQ